MKLPELCFVLAEQYPNVLITTAGNIEHFKPIFKLE